MELLIGALFVLAVALLIENAPVVVNERMFLLVSFVASAVVTWLLFDEYERSVIVWGVAIWGLGLLLRALYRLIRAWADRTEVANFLQTRNQ